jgi:ADP-glucose pyrophosphorylase
MRGRAATAPTQRIKEYVLSNLVNLEVRAIYLLAQYKSQFLIEHIRKSWTISPLLPDQFVTVVPPQMQTDGSWFASTADGAYQKLNTLKEHWPEHPSAMPSDPSHAYALTGNYLFNSDVLIKALDAYFEARQDVQGIEPRFDTFDPQWPIFSSNYQGPVAREIGGQIDNSLLDVATELNQANIRNCVITSPPLAWWWCPWARWAISRINPMASAPPISNDSNGK